MLGQIVNVFCDQRADSISGLPRHIEAAFRGRRGESDGRTHGGTFGWLTPPTIATPSGLLNFSALSRLAVRAVTAGRSPEKSPRRARDRNGHGAAFRTGRYIQGRAGRPVTRVVFAVPEPDKYEIVKKRLNELLVLR